MTESVCRSVKLQSAGVSHQGILMQARIANGLTQEQLTESINTFFETVATLSRKIVIRRKCIKIDPNRGLVRN